MDKNANATEIGRELGGRWTSWKISCSCASWRLRPSAAIPRAAGDLRGTTMMMMMTMMTTARQTLIFMSFHLGLLALHVEQTWDLPHGLPHAVCPAAEPLGGPLQVVRLVLQRVQTLAALRDLVDVVAHDADGAVDLLLAVSTDAARLGICRWCDSAALARCILAAGTIAGGLHPVRERHSGGFTAQVETYGLKRGGPRVAALSSGASRRGSAAVGGDVGVVGLVVGHFAG
jgi:hypothetical protein